MSNFEVADGRRCAIDGKIYEAGQSVTVEDADSVDALVERGILVKPGRTQQPSDNPAHGDGSDGAGTEQAEGSRRRVQRG